MMDGYGMGMGFGGIGMLLKVLVTRQFSAHRGGTQTQTIFRVAVFVLAGSFNYAFENHGHLAA